MTFAAIAAVLAAWLTGATALAVLLGRALARLDASTALPCGTDPTPAQGHPPMNPDLPCPHPDFDAFVSVARITATDDGPPIAFSATITVACSACAEPFRWTGVRAGLSSAHPTCNLTETELIAPLRPASSDPDFGLGLPGFAVTYQPGPDDTDTPDTRP
ncbi:hypothetical protein VSR01_16520 [Actinacidiphila sp. DG2A-62]|uniref:hypothetical protein n=1 Tax=Actinacidiphila sp. DG2A-62 TaxID=3108821 RepID=UPI002DBAACAB|nr:hypothetical protein [Actinacidiphila sp. DG2A-62]MEC3995051.1 hypothetical protein [Actinacidiphila sp. DG2A-62]